MKLPEAFSCVRMGACAFIFSIQEIWSWTVLVSVSMRAVKDWHLLWGCQRDYRDVSPRGEIRGIVPESSTNKSTLLSLDLKVLESLEWRGDG